MSGSAWATSDRAARLPRNWAAIRRTVMRRDGYRCRWVTREGRCSDTATVVDHIEPLTDDHHPDALQSLCGAHHHEKTSRESAAGRRRNGIRRPAEPHPGLL